MDLNDEHNSNIIINVQNIAEGEWSMDAAIDLEAMPVLPTRDSVIFPMSTVPLSLGRESSLLTARRAAKDNKALVIVCQRNPEDENPGVTRLYRYGVLGQVMRVIDLPDGNHTALVRTTDRVRILGRCRRADVPVAEAPLHVRVETVVETVGNTELFSAVTAMLIAASRRFAEATLDPSEPFVQNMHELENNPPMLLNFLCTNLPFTTAEKAAMIACGDLSRRAELALKAVNSHLEKVALLKEIGERTKSQLSDSQRQGFLQAQMESIRQELYGDIADDGDTLLAKAKEAAVPENVMATVQKEVEKLRRYNPSSPDYAIQYAYLDTLVSLPWTVSRPLPADGRKAFAAATDILEKEHYGLEKVKERILEQLAMVMRNPGGRQPIICLVGPPGVGKTSLGKSVAEALGKDYQRVSLGGLHDEAEIRGHRRTYIGAMPGRIIDAIRRAGSVNPVLLLDEIDKTGNDYKGDPSSALLEVLDPEQNSTFTTTMSMSTSTCPTCCS